jgi:hypothetical protein
VNHINVKNEHSFWYSSKLLHKPVPKLLFARMNSGVIIDYNGNYGITSDVTGIIDSIDNLEKMMKVMRSEEFMKFMESINFSAKDRFCVHIIKHFKKDFWREFL